MAAWLDLIMAFLASGAFVALAAGIFLLGAAVVIRALAGGRRANVWLGVSAVLAALAVWAFYRLQRADGTSEWGALALALLPLGAYFVVAERAVLARLLDRVASVKIGDIEVVIAKATESARKLELASVDMDAAYFSVKRRVSDLGEELRRAIARLSSVAPSKRVLVLSIRYDEHGEPNHVNAAAVYLYLRALNIAALRVGGRVEGILVQEERRVGDRERERKSVHFLKYDVYLAYFEQRFPQAADLLPPRAIVEFVDAALSRAAHPPNADAVFQQFLWAIPEREMEFARLTPEWASISSTICEVDESNGPQLAQALEDIFTSDAEYVVVIQRSRLSLISVNSLARRVAERVVKAADE